MLTTQFLLVNFHFVVSLLAALITLAIAWLYFDAWTGQKSFKQALPFLGFLFLSLSFVVQSVIVDQSLFETAFEGTAVAGALKIIFRFGGYLTLVAGQLITPLQQRPTRKWRDISDGNRITLSAPRRPRLGATPETGFARVLYPRPRGTLGRLDRLP